MNNFSWRHNSKNSLYSGHLKRPGWIYSITVYIIIHIVMNCTCSLPKLYCTVAFITLNYMHAHTTRCPLRWEFFEENREPGHIMHQWADRFHWEVNSNRGYLRSIRVDVRNNLLCQSIWCGLLDFKGTQMITKWNQERKECVSGCHKLWPPILELTERKNLLEKKDIPFALTHTKSIRQNNGKRLTVFVINYNYFIFTDDSLLRMMQNWTTLFRTYFYHM